MQALEHGPAFAGVAGVTAENGDGAVETGVGTGEADGAVGDAGGGGMVGTVVSAVADVTVLGDDDSGVVCDFDGGSGASISRIIISPPASRSV